MAGDGNGGLPVGGRRRAMTATSLYIGRANSKYTKNDFEGLNVTRELRVEQSYDEIEAAFIPGEEFSFEAIIGLQQTSRS